MSKSKNFDCPDCGSEGGKIKAVKGTAYYKGMRIGFLACTNCGGFWHRNRFELGIAFSTHLDGHADWDTAAATLRARGAFK